MKIDSTITVRTKELTRKEWRDLFTRLTFRDADDLEISAYQYHSGKGVVELPRGTWSMLPSRLEVTDRRSRPSMPKRGYTKTLDAPGYAGQSAAVAAMFEYEQGQIIAPPGRGKTEICLAFAAASKTRVLVVVHTQDLMRQWTDRAKQSTPGLSLGKIQGKTCQVEHLTIAMAQSLKRYINDNEGFWQQFGAIIVDEAHHAAAETWEWLLNVCPAYYRFGVTASQKRSDGRQALVKFNIGPVIYKLKFESQVPMTVMPVATGFKTKYNGQQWQRIIKLLVNDQDRNEKIAEIVAREVKNGNTILVLSRQIAHLENIQAALMMKYPYNASTIKVVTGRMPRPQRDKMIADLQSGDLRCILGTQLFEEGVDIPRINRIILAYPGTEVTALQKIGRGSRKFEGKYECIIYDMLDDYVRVLAKQYLRRRTWYKSVGIRVTRLKEVKDAQEVAKA